MQASGDLAKLGDVCHPNDAGVAALVLALAEFLDEQGLLAERTAAGRGGRGVND